MSKTLASESSSKIINPSLVALKPRQVLLSIPKMGKKVAGDKETKALNLKPDQKVLLLRSVARYLDQSGFSKSLKKLLSEAQIDKKDMGGALLDLEEIFCDYLKRSHDTDISKVETEDIQIHDKPIKDAEESVAAEETNDKKKKKKVKVDENGYNSSAAAEASKETMEENVSNGLKTEIKDKKKRKKKEAKSEVIDEKLKDGSSKSTKEADVEKDDKSKDLESSAAAEASKETLEENVSDHLEKKKKDKKKRKEEPKSDVTEEKLRDGSFEEKKEDANVNTDDKPKDKKEKVKSKSSEAESLKDDYKSEVEYEVKKVPKKRKRPETEEKIEETLDDKEDELKRRKKDNSENNNADQKTPKKQPVVKENGNVEKTGAKSAEQKSGGMELNGSKEPRKPYQRVNIEEVVFTDERLRDNSYWAKDGADSGYGAKAQEVLGQVRGRDFRHEKTKKKRGSYKGGMIDLQSHSVKFNYSDEE